MNIQISIIFHSCFLYISEVEISLRTYQKNKETVLDLRFSQLYIFRKVTPCIPVEIYRHFR
jgi:hypothetical protein